MVVCWGPRWLNPLARQAGSDVGLAQLALELRPDEVGGPVAVPIALPLVIPLLPLLPPVWCLLLLRSPGSSPAVCLAFDQQAELGLAHVGWRASAWAWTVGSVVPAARPGGWGSLVRGRMLVVAALVWDP